MTKKQTLHFKESHYGNWHTYVVTIWRLRIEVTNRLQMFEEREWPSVRGWWIGVTWCGV